MAKPWTITNLDPAGSLTTNARAIIAVRAGELLSYAPVFADPEAVSALHDARIAAKRLRYTLDLFAGRFGEDGAAVLGAVKALQEELGIVHDRDVLIDTIGQRIRELDDEPGDGTDALRGSLESLLGRIRGERAARHRDVAAQWMQLTEAGFRDQLAGLAGDHPIPTAPP